MPQNRQGVGLSNLAPQRIAEKVVISPREYATYIFGKYTLCNRFSKNRLMCLMQFSNDKNTLTKVNRVEQILLQWDGAGAYVSAGDSVGEILAGQPGMALLSPSN